MGLDTSVGCIILVFLSCLTLKAAAGLYEIP